MFDDAKGKAVWLRLEDAASVLCNPNASRVADPLLNNEAAVAAELRG